MNNLCYTAIIGNYDILREVETMTPGWSYICFTDQKIESKTWTIIPILKLASTDVKQARRIKIFPFAITAPYYLWVDANIQIIGDLNQFIKNFRGNNITLMRHPDRDQIGQEINAITKYKKDDIDVVYKQYKKYIIDEKYPDKELAATGIILRMHNSVVVDQANIWLDEVINHSHRDQMSFNYACWKVGVVPNYFPYSEINGKTFKYFKHTNKV